MAVSRVTKDDKHDLLILFLPTNWVPSTTIVKLFGYKDKSKPFEIDFTTASRLSIAFIAP